MATQGYDEAKAGAFAGKMIEHLNGGCLALLCSVAHQTGLFDVMASRPAGTSAALAAAAGLNERYVRELLGGLTVGGIVAHDAGSDTYQLPPEHAAALTRAAGPANLARLTPYIAMMGQVEGGIVECVRGGGGLPYSAYPRFQKLMAEESAATYDVALVDEIVPLAPGLVDRLRAGIDVADFGCGQGHAVNLLATAFPQSRFTGFDQAADGVAAAEAEARARGLRNVRFHQQDLATVAPAPRFDLVTAFDVIHDLAQPTRVLHIIATALRRGGTFLMQDVAARTAVDDNLGHPLGPALYTISTFHCLSVSLSQHGEGLGTAWGEELARAKLREAGFTRVAVHQIPVDPLNAYYVCRKE